MTADPGAGDYWRKGLKNPDSGHPYRHARDKIALLLGCRSWYQSELQDIITALAVKHPESVLDALSDYIAELDEAGEPSPSFRLQAEQFMAANDDLLRRLGDA